MGRRTFQGTPGPLSATMARSLIRPFPLVKKLLSFAELVFDELASAVGQFEDSVRILSEQPILLTRRPGHIRRIGG